MQYGKYILTIRDRETNIIRSLITSDNLVDIATEYTRRYPEPEDREEHIINLQEPEVITL